VKISEGLAKAKLELDLKGVSNSRLDSLILLSYALSFSKEQVIFNPDLELNLEQQQQFFDLVKRRAQREPVSHIIGKREFFGNDFLVNSSVLDPRPDSENLIELVLEKFPNREVKLEFLEVGVGSGCLIISLLLLYKNSVAFGLDISEAALAVAKENAEKNSVKSRLNFLKSDLFCELDLEKKFDVIISNPPYIPARDILNLEPEVKNYEPLLALDGGVDGLDFYRRIAGESKNFLKKNGRIFLEIGFGQKDEIVKIFSEKNFILCAVKQDLSGIERILEFK
jgi:release factor glutamine methyltransferase